MSKTKQWIKMSIDTGSLKNISMTQNNLLTYTVLIFIAVLSVYFMTKDWKGFTAPEELDLGSVRVVSQKYRTKRRQRKTN